MGKRIIGWPGTPALLPKRALVWYRPPTQSTFDEMSAWHLKMIWYPLRSYAYDCGGRLPNMKTEQDVSAALGPDYLHGLPGIFVQPQTGTHYLPNPALSNKEFDEIKHPEQVILYAEAQPAPDGTRGVVFVDGRTDWLTKTEWVLLWSQPPGGKPRF